MPIEEIVFAAVNEVKIQEDIEINEPPLVISPWNDGTYYGEEALQKCGEVMVTSNGKFAYICSSCHYQFLDVQLFGDHFHEGLCCDEKDRSGSSFYREEEIADAIQENAGPHEQLPIENSELYAGEDETTINILCDRVDTGNTYAEDYKNQKDGTGGPGVERNFSELDDNDDDELKTSKSIKKLNETGPLCAICCRMFLNEKTFRTHLSRQHADLPFVGVKNQSIEYLEQNLVEIAKGMICMYCDKQFQNMCEFKKHLHDHNTYSKLFACKYCSKTFPYRRQRDMHMNIHENNRPYKCTHCPKAFANSTNLKSHIRIHLQIKNFICSFCGKAFVKGTDRRIHERIHTKELPYQCEECGARFITQRELTHHFRRHYKIRNVECSQCDRTFYNQYLLREHIMAAHTKERAFECPTCGKKFLRRRTLSQHKNIHTTVKKFKCRFCGKAFAQSAGLRAHVKRHESVE